MRLPDLVYEEEDVNGGKKDDGKKNERRGFLGNRERNGLVTERSSLTDVTALQEPWSRKTGVK